MTDDDPICFAQVPQDLGGDELVARLVGQVINGGPGDHCRVEISLSQVARRDSGYRSPDCRTAGLGDVNDPESAPLSAAHHPPHHGNVSDHAKSNVNRRDQMHRGLSVTKRGGGSWRWGSHGGRRTLCGRARRRRGLRTATTKCAVSRSLDHQSRQAVQSPSHLCAARTTTLSSSRPGTPTAAPTPPGPCNVSHGRPGSRRSCANTRPSSANSAGARCRRTSCRQCRRISDTCLRPTVAPGRFVALKQSLCAKVVGLRYPLSRASA